jgi:RNA polymerase sigma-70 factor (ECF subfamily)
VTLTNVEEVIGLPEADLVGLANAGDAEAFARLVEPHLARALSSARLIAGRSTDGTDVVQEALLSAWRGLGGLRDAASFGAWFRRHVVRAALRAAKHAQSIDRWVDAVDPLDHDVELRQLQRAFARLDPDDRAVLTLQFHLGLAQQETARLLNVPVGTVKSRVHYALSRLRAAFDAEERG